MIRIIIKNKLRKKFPKLIKILKNKKLSVWAETNLNKNNKIRINKV